MWGQILITAIASAATTVLALFLAYRWLLAPRLEARLQTIGDELEERVRSGVLAAGNELLPAFREQVTEGFRDAVAGWPVKELRQGWSNLFGDALKAGRREGGE